MLNNNQNDHNSSDTFTRIAAAIRKIPPWLMGFLASSLPIILMIVGGMVVIIFVMAASTGIVSELSDSIKEGFSSFGDKLVNFWNFGDFTPSDELAAQYEEEYYQKLADVSEKYSKSPYNLTIDTTLITATLFYNRQVGDYVYDEDVDHDLDNSDELEDLDPDNADSEEEKNRKLAQFYKVAKGHVETLARYMIVTTKASNSCVPASQYDPATSNRTDPETPEEIARRAISEDWLGSWGFNLEDGIFRVYNARDVYHVEAYDESGKGPSCPFEDVEPFYRNQYQTAKDRLVSAREHMDEVCSDVTTDTGQEVCTRASVNYNYYYNNVQELLNQGYITDENPDQSSSKYTFNCIEPYSNSSTPYVKYDGCSMVPYQTLSFSIDTSREGVYYYKLIQPLTILGINVQDSFLEKYYSDFVKNEDGTTDPEALQETLDGIYDLYEYFGGGVSSGSGLVTIPGGQFSIRTSPADLSNRFYYDAGVNRFYASGINGGYNPNQCTTYAFGRALEIQAELGVGGTIQISGHAGQWYANNAAKGSEGFPSSTDINAPRPGAWIVWSSNSPTDPYGHVAIVENVYPDGTFSYSEGNSTRSNTQGFVFHDHVSPDDIRVRDGGRLHFVGYIYVFG